MATTAGTTGDISAITAKIKEQTASQNIASSVQEERSSKIEKSIDKWAKDNKVNLDGLAHSNVSESATQMTAVVDQLVANMDENGMNSGEIWDELKSMHIGLADPFEQQYDFDVQKWREEKERLAELDRKAESKAEGKDATDLSLGFNPLLILTAITGFIIGFFQGFFGPMGALMKGWGTAIKNFFGKPLKFGWTKFSDLVAKGPGKWYKAFKGWFSVKFKFGWTKFITLVKKLTFFDDIKAWFTAAQRSTKTGKFMPSKWTTLKNL